MTERILAKAKAKKEAILVKRTMEEEHLVTEEQCQEMIDKAIDKHNKTATLISASIGTVLLFFYAQGLLIVVGLWK